MKVLIDSTDVTNYVLNAKVNKTLAHLGNISPNKGTIELDAVQSYTLSDLEGKTVVLKDDSDNTYFTGVTLKGKTSVDKKTVKLPIRDKWYSIRDTACTNKTWKDTSLQTIIQDVIDMTGETSYSVEDPSITVSWFSVSEDDKVRGVLGEISQSLMAHCYYDSSGTLQFTAGFNSSFSTATKKDFELYQLSSITTEQKDDEHDYSEVLFSKKEFKGNKEEVFNGANDTNHWLVDGDGVGVSDDYYVKLSKRIYELEPYADVAFDADTELTLDSTTYNSNFQTGSQPEQDRKIIIKITNSSSVVKDIREFIIEGKVLREVQGTATYTPSGVTGSRVLKMATDVIDDATWAAKLAQYRLENQTGAEELSIDLAELDFTLDLGDKISFDSIRYVIDSISTGLSSVRITAYKDREAAFSYSSESVSVSYSRDSEESWFADGLAPATPTGLALSTVTSGHASYIQASWDANSEDDLKGYELQWGYDGSDWFTAGVITDVSYTFLTRPNQTIYVRLRATDIEGLESSWTSSVTITSATGSGSPDWTVNTDSVNAPTGIAAAAKTATIEVNWSLDVDYNVNYVSVERAEDPYTSYSEVARVKGTSYVDLNVDVSTSYKYRARSVSYTGAYSAYSTASAAVTPSAYLGGDGAAPSAPTGLSLSTEQPTGEYKSVITPSWNASTSIDVDKYIVEYKQQGTVWGKASSAETNGLSTNIEVEPLLWYDVRVKAVDVEEKESSWVSDSIKSSDISGDGSSPNNYRFISASCEAVVLNRTRYAHLKWEAASTASPDVESFVIFYRKKAESAYSSLETALVTTANPGYTFFLESEKAEYSGDVFEAYIEIPDTDEYNFSLFVQDYDGNNVAYYSSISADGYITLDFALATIDTTTPGAPSVSAESASYKTLSISITTSSNVEPDWVLQVQCGEVIEEWGESTYDFEGQETYCWEASTTYVVVVALEPSEQNRGFRFRARFKNRDGATSSYSSPAYDEVPAKAYGSAPSTPSGLSVSGQTIGSLKFVHGTCDNVTDADTYEWKITKSQNFIDVYHTGESSEPEIFISVNTYDANYNYIAVRAKNPDGESNWAWASTDW